MKLAWAVAAVPLGMAGFIILAKTNKTRRSEKKTGTGWVVFGLVLAAIALCIFMAAV